MTMWRLELMRLWRTQRWLILLAVFVAFGLIGPLTARYLPELMESLGEDAAASLPPMTPPDGIAQYIGNAVQIGLLAVAFVGAAGLAFDAKLEIAVFLRTRASVRDIFTPRFVLTSVAAVGAFVAGMVVAYIGTGVLMEWLEPGPVIAGAALFALYLVFAIALIGLVSSFSRSVPVVAILSVAILIGIGLLSLVSTIAPWLPSTLVGAVDTLIRGGEFDFWRAIASTTVLIVGMVALTIRRLDDREL